MLLGPNLLIPWRPGILPPDVSLVDIRVVEKVTHLYLMSMWASNMSETSGHAMFSVRKRM